MSKSIENDTWVYVIIKNAGSNEHLAGLHDDVDNLNFIPCFFEKDHAENCLADMFEDDKDACEVQAILYEELSSYAKKNGFMVYSLDFKGNIINKIKP
jgi:hypothetical protein